MGGSVLRQKLFVDGFVGGREAADGHLAVPGMILDGREGYLCGLALGIAVHACADAGEGYGLKVVHRCQVEGSGIAAVEQLGFVLAAAAPHWADGMDHMLGWEPVSAGDFALASEAAAKGVALIQQFRAGGAVYCSVYSPASEQGHVGGIDYGIDSQLGDVALYYFYVLSFHVGLSC